MVWERSWATSLIWVDDIFQYLKTFTDLLANLRRMFARILEKKVFLNTAKSTLCSISVTCCGRRIDAHGVIFDDTMVQGLV
jgi:hypothetical protein